jgi:hypothetical protein
MKKCFAETDSTFCIIFGFPAGFFTPKSCETSHLAKSLSFRYNKGTERVIPMI